MCLFTSSCPLHKGSASISEYTRYKYSRSGGRGEVALCLVPSPLRAVGHPIRPLAYGEALDYLLALDLDRGDRVVVDIRDEDIFAIITHDDAVRPTPTHDRLDDAIAGDLDHRDGAIGPRLRPLICDIDEAAIGCAVELDRPTPDRDLADHRAGANIDDSDCILVVQRDIDPSAIGGESDLDRCLSDGYLGDLPPLLRIDDRERAPTHAGDVELATIGAQPESMRSGCRLDLGDHPPTRHLDDEDPVEFHIGHVGKATLIIDHDMGRVGPDLDHGPRVGVGVHRIEDEELARPSTLLVIGGVGVARSTCQRPGREDDPAIS